MGIIVVRDSVYNTLTVAYPIDVYHRITNKAGAPDY